MKSNVFKIKDVDMGSGVTEQIVRGGRDNFAMLPKAFSGINQIGVIGWGSQGPAQAQNLRDSLAGLPIKVKVGLQKGSSSVEKAKQTGFTSDNGTLGEMFQVISESDLVLLLISDSGQVEQYSSIFAAMRPGTTLGFSHGFLLGHMEGVSDSFPKNINVIGVCPKGMGPSVRRLYEQGKEVNGAGINCSIAIEQDIDGRATNTAIGWAIAIGAPFVFETTLRNERISDLFGERSVLLAQVYGMVEALYRYFVMECAMSEEEAFEASVENVTGIISPIISKSGIIGLYNLLSTVRQEDEFEKAYSCAYGPYYELMQEIYDEVASGNEIKSVVMTGERLKGSEMSKIDGTRMWSVVGEKVRVSRSSKEIALNPVTAGFYCAAMMAQIDTLLQHSHCLSEVCNESVIEAVDSLNPFMHYKGVAYMVDNCSRTARLGTRKWGPRWDYATMQLALVSLNNQGIQSDLIAAFKTHRIHDALRVCASMRPTVDIAVVG